MPQYHKNSVTKPNLLDTNTIEYLFIHPDASLANSYRDISDPQKQHMVPAQIKSRPGNSHGPITQLDKQNVLSIKTPTELILNLLAFNFVIIFTICTSSLSCVGTAYS